MNLKFKTKLKKLDKLFIKRELILSERKSNAKIIRNNKKLISFSCNDYLGLTQHREVINANINATKKYGTGAGASRLISGNHNLYKTLEDNLAKFKKGESACVFGSGFLTNIGVIPAITSKNDLLLYDELSHASANLGIKLCKANTIKYKHNNINHLIKILNKKRKKYKNCFVFTEGVFSMDGDRAKLNEISELSKTYNFAIILDDAHGFGVLGNGKGSQFEFKPNPKIFLQMGTLSKAIGSYGGFIVAPKVVIDIIHNKARSLIYTTGLPPGTIAASIKSLEIIKNNKKLVNKPIKNATFFTKLLNLPEPESCIVSIIVKTEQKALNISKFLEDNGYYVGAIRPPTVPKNTSRLRFTFTSMHTKKDVINLANLVKSYLN